MRRCTLCCCGSLRPRIKSELWTSATHRRHAPPCCSTETCSRWGDNRRDHLMFNIHSLRRSTSLKNAVNIHRDGRKFGGFRGIKAQFRKVILWQWSVNEFPKLVNVCVLLLNPSCALTPVLSVAPCCRLCRKSCVAVSEGSPHCRRSPHSSSWRPPERTAWRPRRRSTSSATNCICCCDRRPQTYTHCTPDWYASVFQISLNMKSPL